MKRNTVRWSEEFVKKVYVSESVDPSSRGRPPGRWRGTVNKYMYVRGSARRGGMNHARRECLDRERWRLFCCGHTFGSCFLRE